MFDDIPEDREPTYACKCGGTISQNIVSGKWECFSCDFSEGGEEDDE